MSAVSKDVNGSRGAEWELLTELASCSPVQTWQCFQNYLPKSTHCFLSLWSSAKVGHSPKTIKSSISLTTLSKLTKMTHKYHRKPVLTFCDLNVCTSFFYKECQPYIQLQIYSLIHITIFIDIYFVYRICKTWKYMYILTKLHKIYMNKKIHCSIVPNGIRMEVK